MAIKIIQPPAIQTIQKIANLDPNYQNTPRQVTPLGIFHESEIMLLKLYDMYIIQESSTETVNACKEFLKKEIENKTIKPYLGFGFAILSKDMLNVARWDTTYPIVLQNNLYEFGKKDFSDAKLLNIQNFGSFCAWELGIVNFEKNQWIKYLDSERNFGDKLNYLSSFWKSEK